MGLARQDQGARRRRGWDIVDDEQRRDRLAPNMRLGRFADPVPVGFRPAGYSTFYIRLFFLVFLAAGGSPNGLVRHSRSLPRYKRERCQDTLLV